ncbi:hypothetical protein ACUH9Y_02920 [Dermabacteraceae bacterium P13115]
MAQFRRPASLSLARQEKIPGEPDPAGNTELAHASATALLSRVRRDCADPELVERVVGLVQREGIDDVAALWSHSPAGTLPGMMWRLYAIHAWVHSDPAEVARRYQAGIVSAPGLRFLAGVEEPPGVDQIRATLDDIMRGVFTGDLSLALERASAVVTLVAYGTAHLADDGGDPQQLTLSADRLLATAEELAEGAELERRNLLS